MYVAPQQCRGTVRRKLPLLLLLVCTFHASRDLDAHKLDTDAEFFNEDLPLQQEAAFCSRLSRKNCDEFRTSFHQRLLDNLLQASETLIEDVIPSSRLYTLAQEKTSSSVSLAAVAQTKASNIAVVVRMVAPIDAGRMHRLQRTAVSLFRGTVTPDLMYRLVAIVDETSVTPGSTEPYLRGNLSDVLEFLGVDSARVEFFGFTNKSLYDAFPAFHHYMYEEDFGQRRGAMCCGRPDMWLAQREPVLAWRHSRKDKALSFKYIWFIEDDVEFLFNTRGKLATTSTPRSIQEYLAGIDTSNSADLYGFEICQSWSWGRQWHTSGFTQIMEGMKASNVPERCFSDGLQRLTHAMLDALELEIRRSVYGWAELMLQPIAWKHGLKWEHELRSTPLTEEIAKEQPHYISSAVQATRGLIGMALPPNEHRTTKEIEDGLEGSGSLSKIADFGMVVLHSC